MPQLGELGSGPRSPLLDGICSLAFYFCAESELFLVAIVILPAPLSTIFPISAATIVTPCMMSSETTGCRGEPGHRCAQAEPDGPWAPVARQQFYERNISTSRSRSKWISLFAFIRHLNYFVIMNVACCACNVCAWCHVWRCRCTH